ncbi:MAG: (Fe-S)-binding protein [Bacteroidetes bacterium]|nr:(Fe-S)-binding protein [Bacteroidota bacterium]
MKYDPFVIPFCLGAIILAFVLIYKYFSWIFALNKTDKHKILKGIFSVRIFKAIKEVFLESLLHRKVFRVNPMLGYMHMSLAFGWLLLILGGTIESKVHSLKMFNTPYEPIFFKFFNHDISMFSGAEEFKFVMDLLLLFVLSGVSLAFIKRFYSKLFGMKKTTKLKIGDWMALTALWFIFPLRFFAESFTSGIYHNGGFLTGTAGNFFASFLPLENLTYIAWWAYSIALGAFFIALPFSRYMHIFTEVVLIFLRNFGIKSTKEYNSFSEFEIHSCSRCGICLDKCQLLTAARIKDTQAVYFLQSIRYNNLKEGKAFDCMLCGKCQEFCPVAIDLNNIRISKRMEFASGNNNFDYLIPKIEKTAPIIYFAGCMTHLTPTIKIAMESIFKESKTDYLFLDKDGGICCGRPLMLAGEILNAQKLIEKNVKLIKELGAKTLVTSCPICLKVFKEDYELDIEIVHHTQFILKLAEAGKIKLNKSDLNVVYHDPCELGRGSGIYDEPRTLINKVGNLKSISQEKELSLCCGSSLAGIQLNSVQKELVRIDTLKALEKNNPDCILTACPLCKKTLAKDSSIDVKDISELVWNGITESKIVELTQNSN